MTPYYTPSPALLAAREYCQCETMQSAFEGGFDAACNMQPRVNPWWSGPLAAWEAGYEKGQVYKQILMQGLQYVAH